MYENESINDYIRSILGYPTQESISDTMQYANLAPVAQYNTSELENCYPEIYKIVYPMITKRCSSITEPISNELIENMTNEIYFAIEGENEIQININLNNRVSTKQDNVQNQGTRNQMNRSQINRNEVNVSQTRQLNRNTNANEVSKVDNNVQNNSVNNNTDKTENRGENRQSRQIRNTSLRDLIKILIIRELLNRPGGNRPPMPRPPFPGEGPNTPRPPFLGIPGNNRPPIMPRDYDFYE